MKVHTTNYTDSFIEIAEDSPTTTSKIPPLRNGKETVASLQYQLIRDNPYRFTSDEVLFQVYARQHELKEEEMEEAQKEFFSKVQACLRASPLTKKYGWGIHFNGQGKLALVARESAEYTKYLEEESLVKKRAMRSSRK